MKTTRSMKRYFKSSIFIIDTKDRLSDSPRELEIGNFFQNPRDVLGTNFTLIQAKDS